MFPPCSMPSFPTIYSLSWRKWGGIPTVTQTIKHQSAPSWGGKIVVVQRLYHTSPAQSTPSAVFMGHPYSPHCP